LKLLKAHLVNITARMLKHVCLLSCYVFNVSDGYAPFLSMTSRETFLNITDQVVAAPGPGHYDPAFAQDNVKVRCSCQE